MAWPNPNEYVEALQNPQQAFGDADLRGAKVITNKLGLPRPISGNFATVFEVQGATCRWAVRCFLREVTNQQQRYAAISDHLHQHTLDCMVNFEYLPEGIRIRGKWYPILKMDWTPGTRLDTYIEQHLNDSVRLRQLAERWLVLCRSLGQAHIAHGDLQHGNILVTNRDEIKLIDYDGMSLASVIGLGNGEIGHRHYQHPTRQTDKGITLDNFQSIDHFSCYVIGLSLAALSMDGSLWERAGAGEENLLFRDSDYRAPQTSPVFDLLASHEDPRVRTIAQMMLEAVEAPNYLAVPPFEHLPPDTRLTQMKSWLINWVATGLPTLNPSVSTPTAPAPLAKPKSWVFDHVEKPKDAQLDFADEFVNYERLRAEVEFDQSPVQAARFLLPAFALLNFVLRYRSYPLVIEKTHFTQACRTLEQRLVEAKTRRKTLSRLIVEADQRYQQELRSLETLIGQFASDLASSQQQEAREIARLERALHSAAQELADQRLEPGRIPGIEAAQVTALALVGIRTAADIQASNETSALHALNALHSGSPHIDWDRLLEWRNLLEQRVSPNPISAHDLENIRQRYADAQHDLALQRDAAAQQLDALQAHSSDQQSVQTLRADLAASEAEVTTLQQQYNRAQHELNRYELITLQRFLLKILALPPM